MDTTKQARVEAAGFRVGSPAEFLGLTEEENNLVELRVVLSRCLEARRAELHISQQALARHLGSDQSRVSRMEKGDPSVSFDLLIRAILATGATLPQLAEIISSASGGSDE